MVVIYPLEDGKPYILKSPLKIPSHTYIKGIRKPKIQCGFSEGDYMLGLVGESGSKLESIRIEGLVLDGNKIPKSIFSVVYCGDTTIVGSTIKDCILSGSKSSGNGGINLSNSSNNTDRKSTRLNSSHANISYAVFCLKKKNSLLTASKSTHTSS